MVGWNYVIVRTDSAGVHMGFLRRYQGKEVELTNTRRLWSWVGSMSLSEVAKFGIKEGSKLSVELDRIILTEAVEIIPVADDIAKQLREFPRYG